jgi:hypothetical protein
MTKTRSLKVLTAASLGLLYCSPDPHFDSIESGSQDITSGGVYVIKNVNSGKCVDVTGAATTSGANIEQWDCNGHANQAFKFISVGNGYYEVRPMNSGSQCMDIFQASTANGGNVDQWSCNTHTSQHFKLTTISTGKYELVAQNSGKCLDVAGSSTARGANIQQYTCNGHNNQLFTFTGTSTPAPAPGGSGGSGGTGGTSGSGGSGGSTGGDPCSASNLNWKTANKTWYTSYPAAGSEECIVYSGCQYEGQFQACSGTKSKTWVQSHNIASFFPLGSMSLHDICIKSGTKTLVVTVYDTCGDSDCGGCCTENRGSADALIDLESYTNQRFGVADGRITWADLGPTKGSGCN